MTALAMTVDPRPRSGGDDLRARSRAKARANRNVSQLAVSFERRADVLVIRLVGHLDIYTVPALRTRVATSTQAETPIVIDLREVELLDSSGLGVLIALRNRSQQAGRRLGVVSDDGQLRDVLMIAGLDRAFVQTCDVDAACALVTTAEEPGR